MFGGSAEPEITNDEKMIGGNVEKKDAGAKTHAGRDLYESPGFTEIGSGGTLGPDPGRRNIDR